MKVSIHARLRGAGRPKIRQMQFFCKEVSIHARLRGAGRPVAPSVFTVFHVVSIHARLRGAGRPLEAAGVEHLDTFQSTPGSEEPGDPTSAVSRSGLKGFNPRPAPRSRATHREGYGESRDAVSIHARLRGAGRPRCEIVCASVATFQSTPGSEEPGDLLRLQLTCWYQRFNPRPAPRSRATEEGRKAVSGVRVSIHARLRGAGRPHPQVKALRIPGSFNPRPAPRSRATVSGTDLGTQVPVSIHARLRGAGRLLAASDWLSCQTVSIHARLRGAGRPPRRQTWTTTTCFNPRPAPRSRATTLSHPRFRSSNVSIHARLRGAGRLFSFFNCRKYWLFQSTPGSEEPGDTPCPEAIRWHRCFNPRPAPRSRATPYS